MSNNNELSLTKKKNDNKLPTFNSSLTKDMNIAVYSTIFLAVLVTLSLAGRIMRKKNGNDIIPPLQEASPTEDACVFRDPL